MTDPVAAVEAAFRAEGMTGDPEEIRRFARAAVKVCERDTVRLIEDLTDPGECWFDHHGYCQEHGWMETDPPCPHARAKRLLAEIGERDG